MANLYQYLTENYKENEPFFLSDIQIEGMTGNNIRQQLKKLTDAEKVKRFDKGIYYLPNVPICDILFIKTNYFFKIGNITSSAYLPHASDSWLNCQPCTMVKLIQIRF